MLMKWDRRSSARGRVVAAAGRHGALSVDPGARVRRGAPAHRRRRDDVAGRRGDREAARRAAEGPPLLVAVQDPLRAHDRRPLLPLVRAQPLQARLRRPLPVAAARRDLGGSGESASWIGVQRWRRPPIFSAFSRSASAPHRQLLAPTARSPRLPRRPATALSCSTPAGAVPPLSCTHLLHHVRPRVILQPVADRAHRDEVDHVRRTVVHLDLESHRVAARLAEEAHRAGERMSLERQQRDAPRLDRRRRAPARGRASAAPA